MSDFVEFNTDAGPTTFNVDEIESIESKNSGSSATINLKSGVPFDVLEPYEDVSSFVMWVADGRPDYGHDENCPDCGGELEEISDVEEDEEDPDLSKN